MKELGAYLKRVRISNGVNIAEAAEDLDLTVSELENIESGNVKAFKDLYDLKDYIRAYSKYLGLNSEKVVDEFNGFLFDHTSKLSITDIANYSQNKKESVKVNKIKSPYTMEYKKKSYALPIFFGGIIFVALILFIIYLVVNITNKVPTRVDELSPVNGKEIIYEFTY